MELLLTGRAPSSLRQSGDSPTPWSGRRRPAAGGSVRPQDRLHSGIRRASPPVSEGGSTMQPDRSRYGRARNRKGIDAGQEGRERTANPSVEGVPRADCLKAGSGSLLRHSLLRSVVIIRHESTAAEHRTGRSRFTDPQGVQWGTYGGAQNLSEAKVVRSQAWTETSWPRPRQGNDSPMAWTKKGCGGGNFPRGRARVASVWSPRRGGGGVVGCPACSSSVHAGHVQPLTSDTFVQ